MRIYLNGKEEEIPENCTVQEMLQYKNVKERASVWINGEQILAGDYSTRKIEPDDQIKLVRILGGG